ncbi:MAG: 7-cyano-7-deazaguanine synthase QueC [Xanthomonadaceae bacterium]|nr:7-cyano-7-deazaguanine synthase QueC [Xanthomonadaceae bacterium]
MISADSIVLLSGGLDSTANLAMACDEGKKPLCLTIRYGQRAEHSEIRATRKLIEYYGATHEIIDLGWLGHMGGSSLTDSARTIPTIKTSELDTKSVTETTAKSVWVPNRNGIFIEIAGAIADSRKISSIYVGFNAEEAVTFPDNSTAYMNAINQALSFSTSNQARVESYTHTMTKREIVAKLKQLKKPFPFELVWSCYFSGEKACGTCESCQRYSRAVS